MYIVSLKHSKTLVSWCRFLDIGQNDYQKHCAGCWYTHGDGKRLKSMLSKVESMWTLQQTKSFPKICKTKGTEHYNHEYYSDEGEE